MRSLTPEQAAFEQIGRELFIWRMCLRRCNPSFAKGFIMKLRELGAIDDAGTRALIRNLRLEAA